MEENQITIIDEAQRVWGENRIQGWYNESISEYEILLQHIKRLKQWSTTIIFIGIDQQLASNETSYYDQWIYAMKTLKLPSHKFRIFKPSSFNLEDSTYLITNEDKLKLTNSVRNNQSHQFTSLINSIIANPNRKGLKKLIKLFKSEGLQLFISRSLEDCATFFNSIPGEKKPSTALIGTPICSVDENLELGIEYESAQKVKIKNIFDQEYPISSDNLIKNGLTQFQVLGLEFDIPIIQWNADYLYYNNKWNFDWEKRIIGFGFFYIKNAYRVLLTRGRNGLIIYIPQHWKFNETYNYFKNLGFENLDSSTIQKTKSNFQNTML